MYGHVITKFSRMGSLPHFFTHGAPLRASRARAPLLVATNLRRPSRTFLIIHIILRAGVNPKIKIHILLA